MFAPAGSNGAISGRDSASEPGQHEGVGAHDAPGHGLSDIDLNRAGEGKAYPAQAGELLRRKLG